MEEALRYIEANYAHSVNIQVIADHLNIERTYLYRLFKDITGVSPQEYLLDYRIRRACSLLKETDLRSAISPDPWGTEMRCISPGCLSRKKEARPHSTVRDRLRYNSFVFGVFCAVFLYFYILDSFLKYVNNF